MDEFIAIIKMFGGNFAPRGWMLCNGQILSIAQYTAQFSILGTTYGGNGQTTFALPNFQGRVPMHWGNGAGLTPHSLGEMSGSEKNTILQSNMPAHVHSLQGTVNAVTTAGSVTSPAGNYLAASRSATAAGFSTTNANPTTLAGGTVTGTTTPTGGSDPLSVMQPYLCVTFIICMEGIFPSRN